MRGERIVTDQMRVLQFLNNLYIIQLDIQELVYRLQGTTNLDIIFKLHGDFMVDESFKKAEGGFISTLQSDRKLNLPKKQHT